MPRFKDEEYLSAAEKEKILALWIRFLKNNFQRNDFTHQLYNYLMNHADFIAHYSIHGFYAEYFTTGEDKIRFLKQFDRAEMKKCHWYSMKLTGDYSDLNNAMVDEAAKYLGVLYAGARQEQKTRDLTIANHLLAKYGLTLENAVKPLQTAKTAMPEATQANLF